MNLHDGPPVGEPAGDSDHQSRAGWAALVVMCFTFAGLVGGCAYARSFEPGLGAVVETVILIPFLTLAAAVVGAVLAFTIPRSGLPELGLVGAALAVAAAGWFGWTTLLQPTPERPQAARIESTSSPSADFRLYALRYDSGEVETEMRVEGRDWTFRYRDNRQKSKPCEGELDPWEATALVEILKPIVDRAGSGEPLCNDSVHGAVFAAAYEGSGGDWFVRAGPECLAGQPDLRRLQDEMDRIQSSTRWDGRGRCK